MSEEALDAAEIKGLSWRQGSILPPEMVRRLRADGALPEETKDDEFWVVLSHSCDVVNTSFQSEPTVELIRVSRLASQPDGALGWLRNPRVCQFREEVGGTETDWQVLIHDHVSIDRTNLLGHRPDPERALQAESIGRLRLWAASRYTRAAFPDEFNKRCSPAKTRLKQKLKSKGHLLTGIYLRVTDEELEADVAYEVTIIGSMHEDMYGVVDRRHEAQQLLDEIETAFDPCDGIEVRESSLRSEDDLRLGDLRFLKRWDWDYLSLRDDSVDALPPIQ